VVAACRLVAERYGGKRLLKAYEAFDAINAALFGGRLPYPLIVWGLTPHGGCQGYLSVPAQDGLPPTIFLHQSLLGGSERPDPWGTPPAWLGWRYAYDVLIHECTHIHINYVLGGRGAGTSSHDCEAWVDECNRLAPLVGLPAIRAGRTKVVRVAVEGPLTKRGKQPTKPKRVCLGDVPMDALANFPGGVRVALGLADAYYRQAGDGLLLPIRCNATDGSGSSLPYDYALDDDDDSEVA
jgi:hypothetical protein